MEPIRITKGISSDNYYEIQALENDNTSSMIEMCEQLVNNKQVLYVGNTPYIKANLPEFICDMHKLFYFRLDEVYNKYISTINAIREAGLNTLSFLKESNNAG